MLDGEGMRLYSYRVARDYGFAPNPFHGNCTLATCKPRIRKTAEIGDWVVGTGSKRRSREEHIVYAMRVTEILTFDKYWNDPRFIRKRPNLSSSLKNAYGDNIYHRDTDTKEWIQKNSHHSHADGAPNVKNICRDTSTTDRVLVSNHFFYWGGHGPQIPRRFLGLEGCDIRCPGIGHKRCFPESTVSEFIDWIESEYECNQFFGRPLDWD